MASVMIGVFLLGSRIGNPTADSKLVAKNNNKFAFAPPFTSSFARRPLAVQSAMLKNGRIQRQSHFASHAAAAGATMGKSFDADVDYRDFQNRHKRLLDRIEMVAPVDTGSAGHPDFAEAPTIGYEDDGTIAVVLLNLGGPDKLEDVEPFLKNLFSDTEANVFSFPKPFRFVYKPLGKLISKGRAPSSREKYASIGGGSPQLAITKAQGRAIEAALGARGIRAKSYISMRYWSPYASDVVQAIKEDGIKRVVVLSLYPQFSMSTTGSSLRALEHEFKIDPSLNDVRDVVVPSFHERVGYINALAGQIKEKIDLFSKGEAPCVLFTAHGLPTRFLRANEDPYQAQTEETVAAVMKRLREIGYLNDFRLAYQSRVGPVEWLRPYTDDVIKQLASEGQRNLVVVPISFVGEHIETLEEIDMEYKEVAEKAGITGWQRVPALGTNTDFINDLAEAVIEVLPQIENPSPLSLSNLNDLLTRARAEQPNAR